MVNQQPPGNRPLSGVSDPDRGRSPQADAPRGRRHSLADVLAAVMLLLATLTYLGRLVWGLSQPGYAIQPRDFGSLLAAIISIPAGVLLVTGTKPGVARVTGALGAGAMLLFNVVNLTGGSVDDVIGKYGTWAAIPIVVTTFIAIVALYRASWSSGDQEFATAPENEEYPGEDFAPPRSTPEQSGGVIGVPEPAFGAAVLAPPHSRPSSAFAAAQPAPEPLFPEPFLPESALSERPSAQPAPSERSMPETASSERPTAQTVPPERPIAQAAPLERPMAAAPPERPMRERPGADQSQQYSPESPVPELSLPEPPTPRPEPAETFPPERSASRSAEPEAAGPALPAAAAERPPVPTQFVPERLTSQPPEPEAAAAGPAQPQSPPQPAFVAAQTPPTEPFAQPGPSPQHAEADGIPAVLPVDPPTAVLPRPDLSANPAQSPSAAPEFPQPGLVIGSTPPVHSESQRHDGVIAPAPFGPPETEPVPPGHGVGPQHAPAPETAPLRMGHPGAAQQFRQPEPLRPDDVPAPRRGGFPEVQPPRPGSGPMRQPFGPPAMYPPGAAPSVAPGDAQHGSLRLPPGTEPIPAPAPPRQPVLRQPGGFLAPPPVDPEPASARQPHPNPVRPQLHDVSAAERAGSYDPRAHPDDDQPVYLDHRQSPPKRLAPPPWAQEQ